MQPRLPFMKLPDSLARDTMARRRFEVGRRAAHVFAHQSVTVGRPVAPGLPWELVPSQPALHVRAATAYALGFDRQVDQDRQRRVYPDNDAAATVALAAVGIVGVIVLLGLLLIAAVNAVVGPVVGAISMHTP